ncbi:MAG: helix-turn-helix domain-containing protein, partial [Thermodesulfobacteriota bacterium]
WPGNVRELENVIERAVILETAEEITSDALSLTLEVQKEEAFSPLSYVEGTLSLKVAQKALEKEIIQRALKEARGNRSKAAQLVELSYRAFLYKMREYGIEM